MKTSKIVSYLFYTFLIGAFLVPSEYRLIDIELTVPFSEYIIGLILLLIIRDLKK